MRRFLLLSLAAVSLWLLLSGCFSNNNFSLLPDYEDKLSTRLVAKPISEDTKDRILILDVEGVIAEWGSTSIFYDHEPTTTVIRRKLEKAAHDERIKAVVLRVNSPGGTVTGSDIVYRDLRKFKERTKLPVVAAFMGVAASGGYYVSCTADTIVAHPTSITGSIGVIMHSFGFAGLFQKIGMESRVIKAGKMKDMGNPFDEMTDEERQILQRIVDESYERFVTVVDEGRPNLNREQVLALADGRILSAADAKRVGLVDQLGDLDDAIEEAKRLAKIRDAGVILYTTSKKPDQNIYSLSRAEAPRLNLDMNLIDYNQLMEMAQPRILYMWMGM
ncbi:MAG: signal peptide peptidase SppA [Myxococcales bacterium]|nr:signal peptide peptidase SppA [Myxococcales bacterium]